MLTRCKSKQVQCNICLQPCVSVIGRIQCRHSYCYECIIKWSEINNTCPMCKANIFQVLKLNVNADIPSLLFEYHQADPSKNLPEETQLFLPQPQEPQEDSLNQDTPVFDSRRPRPFRGSYYGLL